MARTPAGAMRVSAKMKGSIRVRWSKAQAMTVFDPREGVDRVWPGDGVIYSQRLSALRTRSRLSRIGGTPAYRLMTIRSWSTTTALMAMVRGTESR